MNVFDEVDERKKLREVERALRGQFIHIKAGTRRVESVTVTYPTSLHGKYMNLFTICGLSDKEVCKYADGRTDNPSLADCPDCLRQHRNEAGRQDE